MKKIRDMAYRFLRWSERYTKTDMVYLARGSFWNYANFIVTNIFAFALSVAFAKLLPKDVYGTYQFLLSIGSILSAFTLSGMNNAIIQAVARGFEGTVRKSIPIQLGYNLLSLLASVGVALYYFHAGNAPIALGVLLIGLLIPISSAFNTYTALISGRKDFKGGFVVGVILTVIYYTVMIVSLFFVRNAVVLVLLNFGINAAVTVGLYFWTIRRYQPNNDIDPTTMSYGKHLSLASVIGIIAGQLDNILVFHILGTVPLAIYAFASTIPERLNSLLKNVTLMAFPKLSERSGKEIKATMVGKSVRLAALSLVVSLAYIVLAPYVFGVFFPKYLDAMEYSKYYALALVFMALPSMPLTALTALQAKKEIYAYNIANPVVSIACMVVLTARYGILGLIAAKALSGFVNYLISLYLIHRTRHIMPTTNI